MSFLRSRPGTIVLAAVTALLAVILAGRPWITGTVDDVSLYPRALSSSRIAAHFAASKKAPASK